MKIIWKTAFYIMLIIVSVSSLHAQISVAPKVGLSYSTFSGDFTNTKYMPGAYFGGMVNIELQEYYSFQSGLFLSGKGTTLRYSDADDDQMLISYLELPFNSILTVPAGSGIFQFIAGPYLGFAISGRYKYLEDEFDMVEKLQIGTSENDEIKPFDAGITIGTGFLFQGFEVQAAYSRSITNISSLPVDKLFNNVITISMAYFFEVSSRQHQLRGSRRK